MLSTHANVFCLETKDAEFNFVQVSRRKSPNSWDFYWHIMKKMNSMKDGSKNTIFSSLSLLLSSKNFLKKLEGWIKKNTWLDADFSDEFNDHLEIHRWSVIETGRKFFRILSRRSFEIYISVYFLYCSEDNWYLKI